MSCAAPPPDESPECTGPTRPTPQLIHALNLLQEKWVLFIVHALLQGPIGFNEMSRAAGRVNATTLAQRLVALEQAGIVSKTIHSTMPPRTSYELTEAGYALRPVFDAIAAWGTRYMPDRTVTCEED